MNDLPSLAFTEEDLDRLLHKWNEESKRSRWTLAAAGCAKKRDPRRELAKWVEGEARARLAGLGYTVTRMGPLDHFDLLVEGLRVEVKGATWSGCRYEANLRDNEADLLVFGCLDGSLHFFVMPFDVVRGRTVIKVTSHDPRDYMGRWAPYYEAWAWVADLKATCVNPWQLPLF